jgi:hypothetical protein
VISAALLGCIGLLQPGTPHAVIVAVLLAGGFFRSLQFTCLNTIAYADVEPAMMSRATSMASMNQQLSLSVGAGTGALLLHLSAAAGVGSGIEAADFAPAFLIVGLISGSSMLAFLRLPADAGADMAGRAPKRSAG